MPVPLFPVRDPNLRILPYPECIVTGDVCVFPGGKEIYREENKIEILKIDLSRIE
jgi:hypothetical protein